MMTAHSDPSSAHQDVCLELMAFRAWGVSIGFRGLGLEELSAMKGPVNKTPEW